MKHAEILSKEILQLQTQIQTYQAILRNLDKLPQELIGDAVEPIRKLYGVMEETRALVADAKGLDEFLRSDLIKDPLFDKKALTSALLSERYDEWVEAWDGSVKTALRKAGMTVEDIQSEADLLSQITSRFGGVQGNLQALQISNELSSSVARQMVDLRALAATQTQQNSVAWSRVLSDLDRKESAQRQTDVEIQKSIEAYEGAKPGRAVNDILGLGQ